MLSLGCHVDFILMLKKRVIIISKLEYDLLADSSDTGSVHTRVCVSVYVCVCGGGAGRGDVLTIYMPRPLLFVPFWKNGVLPAL